MSQAELFPVPFHGDTIFCTTIDGQPFTPVKPIVENLDLAWQTQQRKLQLNSERWGITIMVIPSEGGQQQTLCMPVRKLPAFLASINPKKVRADLRPKIELYQAECDEALWSYWTKGRAERASAALPAPTLMPQNIKPGVHLHSLEFAGQKLRAATKDGHLWIAVNDLGPALGYAAASGWLPAELPALWEGVLGRDSYDGTWKIVSPRQGKCCAPKIRMLSEEAVRAMIERCTKPRARDFETWLNALFRKISGYPRKPSKTICGVWSNCAGSLKSCWARSTSVPNRICWPQPGSRHAAEAARIYPWQWLTSIPLTRRATPLPAAFGSLGT